MLVNSLTPQSRSPFHGHRIVATATFILNDIRDINKLGDPVLWMINCYERFICVVAPRPPTESSLGSEGRVPVHLDHRVFLAESEKIVGHKRNKDGSKEMLGLSSREVWRVEVTVCSLCCSVSIRLYPSV